VLGPGTRFNTRYPGTRQIPGYHSILMLFFTKLGKLYTDLGEHW